MLDYPMFFMLMFLRFFVRSVQTCLVGAENTSSCFTIKSKISQSCLNPEHVVIHQVQGEDYLISKEKFKVNKIHESGFLL